MGHGAALGLVFAVDPQRWMPVDSRELRKPASLNRCACLRGRGLELLPLTKEDGRRTLRLMHEVIECKEQSEEKRAMTLEWTKDELRRLDRLNLTIAARNVRRLLENVIVPRVGTR